MTGSTRKALDFIADSFVVAVGYGLKRPMIRVHYKDQRFKLYLSRRGTVCLKSGMLAAPSEDGSRDPVGDEEYVGCFLRGDFSPARTGYGSDRDRPLRPMTEVEREFLARLADDPVAFLAACSKDMCRCCYCAQPLEDPRSKAVGYGETCAKRWGLPWGAKKAGEKVPSFAESYDDTSHKLIIALRNNPQDVQGWAVFGDWLEDHGLTRCKAPATGVQLPRNDG